MCQSTYPRYVDCRRTTTESFCWWQLYGCPLSDIHQTRISMSHCIKHHFKRMLRIGSSDISNGKENRIFGNRLTYSMRILQISIAAKTWYFSTASATAASVLKSTALRSGGRWGYMYWNSKSSTSALSERGTISLHNGVQSGGANPSECVSRFLQWILNRTLSQDSNVTSESAAQTGW